MRTSCFIYLFLALLLLTATYPAAARGMWDVQEIKSAAGATYYIPPKDHDLLTTGEIAAIFTNQGVFGRGFVFSSLCDGEVCPSFESPEGSDLEYLFGGAIWIGGIVGEDTLVSVGEDGWYGGITEILPPIEISGFDHYSERSLWALMTDTITDQTLTGTDPYDNRPHIPLHLRIANRAHSWSSTPESKTIIYDMVITNLGNEPVESGYVGFYFDADVYHESNSANGFSDDITGSFPTEGIAYILDNDGDPTGGAFTSHSPTRGFAFRFLQTSFTPLDTAFNWWISNGNAVLDYGPQPVDEFGNLVCDFDGRSGTPTGDVNKYCILSHPGWDFDQIFVRDSIEGWNYPYTPGQAVDFADGYDTRFLMSIGPFDLMPDSSIRLFYTTFTGEDIHVDPDNFMDNLTDPAAYLANLNFTDLMNNATAAETMAGSLIDPALAVIGLYVQHNDATSQTIEWDPYGFPGVDGYNIYLYEVPRDSLPYPSVPPPWITPTELDLHATVEQTYHYTFEDLPLYNIYLTAAANVTSSRGAGQMCDPILLQPGGKPPAPEVEATWIVVSNGDPAVVRWTEPEGVAVDYYNIYKFVDPTTADDLYYPLYDTGEFSATVAPKDSFFVDGVWYYYYAMEPYATVDSGITMYTEYASDFESYVVTAVTTSGLESAFSEHVVVVEGPPRTREILVLHCYDDRRDFVGCPDMEAFFNSVLAGYDYELYYLADTLRAHPGLLFRWWQDLLPFKVVISDVGYRYDFLNDSPLLNSVPGFEIFMASGGILANFGSLQNLHDGNVIASDIGIYPVTTNFASSYLGIDSVFMMGLMYYETNASPPYIDSLIGMTWAEGNGGTVPDIWYNTTFPHHPALTMWWPTSETAPAPATFRINENAEAIQVLKSNVPATSLAEGDAIGVMASSGPVPAFAFGYHLWYMDETGARSLVDYIMSFTGEIVAAATEIGPDTIYAIYANAYNPMSGDIWLGDLSGGYDIGDINTGTLVINGSVTPTSLAVEPSHPDFTGEVVRMTFDMEDFISSYDLLWGARLRPYSISGEMTDGTVLAAAGGVYVIGHTPGDANRDMAVDVGDAVYLLQYIFRDGTPPDPFALGDANGDCQVNVGDIVSLVSYIFRHGSSPLEGCAE